jgi:hypothetical protein
MIPIFLTLTARFGAGAAQNSTQTKNSKSLRFISCASGGKYSGKTNAVAARERDCRRIRMNAIPCRMAALIVRGAAAGGVFPLPIPADLWYT